MNFFRYKEQPIVISIGGSLLVPNGGIDTQFLEKLNAFIREKVKKGKRFFLVSGGGRLARTYRDAGKDVIGDISTEDLDWLGIHATQLNAHLLRTIFQDIAHPRIVINYNKRLINWREPVVIGAGWKPGWSTDYDAVLLARDYGAHLVINLSNIDGVYDKDPKEYKDAKLHKKLTWKELESIVGKRWTPGLNAPFDPVAAQLAKKLGLTVVVANGDDFENLEKIVEGDSHMKGTVIAPYEINEEFYDKEYYSGKKGGMRFGYVGSLVGKIHHNILNLYRASLIKLFINPKTCLDVGCGTGYLIKWLRILGIDAQGIDISHFALASTHEKLKPFIKRGSILHLPYKEDSFDLVVSFDLLEHIERSKIKQAVEETVRVSKKYILHKIYTTENRWITQVHGRDFAHISIFSKNFWENTLRNFKDTRIVKSFPQLPSYFETLFLLRKK